jgi:hypothetical protein
MGKRSGTHSVRHRGGALACMPVRTTVGIAALSRHPRYAPFTLRRKRHDASASCQRPAATGKALRFAARELMSAFLVSAPAGDGQDARRVER